MKRPFRPAPLDWNRPGPDAPSAEPRGPIDIIVPVYGAAAELAVCLASLLRHTDLDEHRLVLVVDGPQEPAVEESLRRVADHPESAVLVVRNPARRGFVGSINRGMDLSERDVVLLNSDTEVTAGWLGKLREAAYSHPAIATVTPFSNNATLASLPRSAEVNALPAGWTVDGFAALVERASARERPRLPTGVGVCLYIKRTALARLGPFDEASFGLGYGEESEFCFRALKAGYLNVLDDATFIWHAGQRSFGASRSPRVRAAHRAMARIHPEYLPTIARFLAEDPVAPARERVLAGLRRAGDLKGPRGPRRIVHLVHGWPPWNHAGTEVYARRLALRQTAWREVAVYSRIADPDRELGEALEVVDGDARVRLVVNNFTQRDPLSRNALHDRLLAADFRRFLAETAPDLIHVHHLAGHAATLMGVAAERSVPIVYQVQDWWAPCARANLFDAGRRLCPGPAPAKCAACLPLTGLSPAAALNPLLHAARARLTRREIRRADIFVMGSRAIRDSYRALGWLRMEDPALVLPYGIERPAGTGEERRAGAPGAPHLPLRFGLLGSILPHKGIHLAVAAFRGIDPARAGLTVWGDPAISPSYTAELEALASPAVRFAGRFDEERRRETLAAIDVLLIPSLGLESFGLAAREALAEGVPVLASRRGALAELFDPAAGPPCGALFDPEDPGELRQWIERLIERPEIVGEWRAAAPAVKEMDEHAEEIEEVYERLLASRARSV
jgi:GT2 family glycosyltransferase/glycosyltransferase involved in cell wall biosynthesis